MFTFENDIKEEDKCVSFISKTTADGCSAISAISILKRKRFHF